MTTTTEIGYAKQKQYAPTNKRRHSVLKDEHGRWITRCTRKPATREYKGWTSTVNCQACLEELEEKECPPL